MDRPSISHLPQDFVGSQPPVFDSHNGDTETHDLTDPAKDGEGRLPAKYLVICRPFMPQQSTDATPFSYYFIDPDNLDYELINSVTKNYTHVLVEQDIARRFRQDGQSLPSHAHLIDNLVSQDSNTPASPRVLLLASNDTHANFMMKVAEQFEHVLFVIPKPERKDEGAAQRLDEYGLAYVEIDYSDRESEAISQFRPDVALSGADWTSEFIALHEILKKLSVPCIALQEGPQDWRMVIKGKDPRKYRNAEILFSQGAVTLKYISPKYFAITGNPKVDFLEDVSLPSKPRVFINCNFTYGEWEENRDLWMDDVLSLCRELGLDYIISKHPRDNSTWDDPNLISSSAFSVKDQLISCSLVVSRFSNIPYEALAVGRPAVYYNPHGETPRTFNEDRSRGLQKAFNRDELKAVMLDHKLHMRFDKEAALAFMCQHCGPMDGGSLDRIVFMINGIATAKHVAHDVLTKHRRQLQVAQDELLFSVIICTHNRADVLGRAIESVLKIEPDDISCEILVIDNASTDHTRKVVEPFLSQDRVRYIFEPGLGLARARNVGVQNAKGRYLVFLDDDGEVTANWLAAFLTVFESHPDAAACGGRIIPKYALPKPDWISGIAERFYGDYDLGDKVTTCDWVPGGNSVWRKDILEALGGYDTRFGKKGHRIWVGGEESQLIKIALNQGYALYYAPQAVMYHHIPEYRITRRYLGKRWLGQGMSDFRYRMVRETWTRGSIYRYCAGTSVKGMKELGNVVANLAQGRKEELLSHFFKLMHLTGLTAEALKFGVTGDFAPKSGTQLRVQTGVPHVAGSANGGDAGPTENGKLNLIVSENAECPVKRRFGGGQLKPFTSSYFSDRNRLFSERLLPEVYRHALDGGDNTYETLLQQPEYGKFDERTIEYSWILRQFAQLEPILKHNVLDVGCVLNNKLIAGYIGNIFDMIWFMNPAPEPLAYDDGVAYIVSDVRAHRLPSGMQFDVVTCLSTLEHIGMDTERYGGPGGEINPYPDQPQRNAVEAVRAMYQLLAPGGVMYLSVPYGPFEYLYDYGGGLPIYYTFDQARLEELLSYIPESEAEISVEIYKVAPGVGWVKTTRDDRTILKHADGCAAAGGVAMVKIVRPPQQLPSKPVDERALRIAVCASNSTTGYSGGRYHAWMIAEALAHVGHEVIIWTDNIPAFRKDFSMFRHDQSLDIQHSPAYRNLPVGPVDVVILVPQLHNRHHFFAKTLYLAAKHKARLVLLNFETPNWFNALSPEPRKSALWDGWLGASQAADMILSLTQEGTHYARDFYTNTVDGVLFRHCYPTINTYAVNAVGRVTRERQIICITRFGRGSKHKGANELLKAIGPATSGYTLAIIVGTGQIESKTRKALEEKARRFNVEIRLLHQLSDQEKFREIKRSKLMLFLSFFEGYGIPIVESLYCDTPCIVYDLPVLQEVGGEGLIYVSPGDEEELQKAIRRVLSGEYNPPVHLSEHIAPLAQFEDFAQRLEVLMQELTALPTEPAVTRIPAALRRQWGSHFFIPLLNLSKQSQQPGADKAKASALRLPSPPEHVGLRQLPAPLNILRKFYHRLVPLQIRLRLRDMRRQAISSSRKLYHQYVPLHLRLRFRDMRHGWLEFLRTGYHAVIPLKTRLFLRNVRVRLIGR